MSDYQKLKAEYDELKAKYNAQKNFIKQLTDVLLKIFGNNIHINEKIVDGLGIEGATDVQRRMLKDI